MKHLRKGTKVIFSILFAVIIAISGMVTLIGHAENVVILEETDPDLTFINIHGRSEYAVGFWDEIKGDFSQEGNKYTMTSNGYAQWYEKDSISFAYKKVIFNYGKNATLTAETTLTSWNGKNDAAGAGILIRSSLDPGAATVMLHCRPSCAMITYRSADGMMSNKGSETNFVLKYPVKFKIVLNKNKLECFYQQPSDSGYIKFGSAQFVYGNSVYVGLSAYSQAQSDVAKATFDGFSYQVEAPEGTEVSKDDTVSSPEGDDNKDEQEEQIVLPADPSVAEDVLLYETFTDGSVSEGEESVTNPIWKTDNTAPEIITTEDNTNRYLYEYMTHYQYFAGDEHWTDYETSLDISFTDDSGPNEPNLVDIYTRLTSIGQYGYHTYVVRFHQTIVNLTPVRSIQLGVIEGASSISPQSLMTVVDEYKGDYVESEDDDEAKVKGFDYLDAGTMNLTIRTFDNTITVYLNGTEILSYKDESDYIKTMGKIGFSSYDAAVTFDNIKVIGLTDHLGGDYDNKVAGLWDKETPSHIKGYMDKGYIY